MGGRVAIITLTVLAVWSIPALAEGNDVQGSATLHRSVRSPAPHKRKKFQQQGFGGFGGYIPQQLGGYQQQYPQPITIGISQSQTSAAGGGYGQGGGYYNPYHNQYNNHGNGQGGYPGGYGGGYGGYGGGYGGYGGGGGNHYGGSNGPYNGPFYGPFAGSFNGYGNNPYGGGGYRPGIYGDEPSNDTPTGQDGQNGPEGSHNLNGPDGPQHEDYTGPQSDPSGDSAGVQY